jgi:UDP-3-O-[3-hydroxymyristoyl] glucosamine N-acyltransferase
MNNLSILKNAGPNSITYYVGNNPDHLKHLKNCTLYCTQNFNIDKSVKQIIVEDPQLEFYKLSKQYKEDYLDNNNLIWVAMSKCYIHKDAQIGNNVKIGAGSIIGNCTIEDNVEIHSNVVIHAKTHIKSGTIIESNTTIGGTGVMWVWDKNERVYLEQLGGVLIEEDCRIGSQCEIVRGSANETTLIGKGTCIAHGTLIGHGCQVGKYVHMANGVKLGGSAVISDYNFIGSGAIISAGVKLLANDIILGSGAVATKDLTTVGVFVGAPAKFIKSPTGKLSGIPTWRS